MVQSLFQISQALCIKQASRITDVGDTPYHLIKPILRRLNSKQLATLEENSPTITPETDELWASLVEKEFADRPFNANRAKLLSTGEDDCMPNRALFKQYSLEKEQFLASSAQRLRKLTANLKKEKSKNSIVPLKGILRDPSIRRRTLAPRTYLAAGARPKSILGKARKDMLERLLMFRTPPSLHQRPSSRPPKNPEPRKNGPDLTAMNTLSPNGIYQAPKRPDSQRANLHSTSRSAAPQNLPQTRPLPPPKEPSVFLQRKKPRRAPAPSPNPAPVYRQKSKPPVLLKSPVKSSIFY